MDDFWICQVCKSVNRPSAGRCYHCRSRRGTRAPEAGSVKRGAAAAAPVTSAARPPAPGFAAAAASSTAPRSAAAGYFAPAAGAAAAGAVTPAYRPPRRLGAPGFLRVPSRFRPAGYVSAWRLGYAAAAAIGALLLVGLLLAFALASPVVESVRDRSIDPLRAAAQPGGGAWPIEVAFLAVGAVALVTFSVFTGLSTRNAPLLGAEAAPMPARAAATAWLNVLWAHGRLAVLLVTPPILFGMGLGIPACIGALVLLEWMQRHQTSLLDWLERPGRHLVELYDKLGLKGVGSLLVRSWRAAFVAANVLLILLWLVPLAISATNQVSRFRKETLPPPDGLVPAQLAVLVLAAAFAVSAALTIGLLVPITAELAQRQRVRRTLVIAGLARPWTGPGQATAGAGSVAGPAGTAAAGRDLDWDDRPATRWSDLGAADREAWERTVEAARPFPAGAPRD